MITILASAALGVALAAINIAAITWDRRPQRLKENQKARPS